MKGRAVHQAAESAVTLKLPQNCRSASSCTAPPSPACGRRITAALKAKSSSATANNRFGRLFSFSRSFSRLAAVFFGGHRTASAFHEYVCSVTPIFLTAIGNRLTSPHLDFDTRSKGDDLLGGFFLSAWHGMPSFGFDHQNISLEVVPL